MKKYNLKPHQLQLANQLLKINKNNLYYLVSQPNEKYKNHTINELKKHILSGIKKYTKDSLLWNYSLGCENILFDYFCFIEFPKEFYQNLLNENIDISSLYSSPHFHLFISPKKNFICMDSLFYYIFNELTSQKLKQLSIKKYDYIKINNLSENFINYHTKQHYHYLDNNRIMTNL
jgi:hypothetical protein